MFTEKHFPDSITGEELDYYLDRGWYRMGQSVFTCHFLFFNDSLYSPIWTRLPLQGYSFRKSLRKIIRRCEQNFHTVIGPADLSYEKEQLYQRYRVNFEGNLAHTLKVSLQDDFEYNIFSTYEIAVYHGKSLVAFSFFDLGKKSIASIKGIYDPSYSAHSLGFYTMLMEIQFGLNLGYEFYYPGYIVPGNPRFDYKLRVGKKEELEFYDLKERGWTSFAQYDVRQVPVEVLSKKLLHIGNLLSDLGITCQLLYYPAYDAKVFGYDNERFLESPLFLNCFNNVFPRPRFIIFYDLWKEKYVFLHCMPFEDLGFYFEYSMHFDTQETRHFLDLILKKTQIAETKDEAELVNLVDSIFKRLKKQRKTLRVLK